MNKRFLMLTICLSALTMSLFAQGAGGPKPKIMTFKFGLKAGANLANINNGVNSLDFSPDMKVDFHVGAVANLHFGHRNEGSPVGTGLFGVQPELLYSRQGFAYDGESYNMDYITLPIMLKVYVMEGLNIEVGPYFSYLLGVSPNSTVIDGAQIKLSDLKGGMDAGIGMGLGFETKIGLTVGARYSLGLSDVADNLAWKNNVISASVGWLF